MTYTLIQPVEQGQRLKVMGGLYVKAFFCWEIRQCKFSLGMCSEKHDIISTILSRVTTTTGQMKLINTNILINCPSNGNLLYIYKLKKILLL